ncbi:MAG: vanadium-dependent haloperoxidase [Chloroflexi bacterium]|nr:vanadium-dependent haloperoxidase [Chloroflexota bacterium]
MIGSRGFRIGATVVAVVAIVGVASFAAIARPWEPKPTCPIAAADHPEWSVARRWDEALLNAIRRALPNPPLHARNLYHLSAAMWDAWAAYDPHADGVFVTEKDTAPDVEAARREAISYAAYRVLSARFINAVGGSESLSEFADAMDTLCYRIDATATTGTSPAAVGNRVAAAVLAAGADDGSNQAGGYAAPDYKPVNPPLVVDGSAITMTDPNRWQPLQIAHMISQNGIPVTNGVQVAVGPHWGHVTSFAIPDGGPNGVPIDPGPPPRLGDPATDQALKDQLIEVIRDSSRLDPTSDATVDISPGARGGNDLGTNDGRGHLLNPATGQPYPANVVNQADFGRVMAEFWADGPKSETPPGHWNVLANLVSDELSPDLRIKGAGPRIDRLQWDVKLYLALNGAVHDAAIAAWGLKGYYDSARPISLIRYMGSLGQSSDPSGPAYNREGLPLVPDLVEMITTATTAPGGRHAALAGHEGEIAVRSWAGNPADPKTQVGGVRWILATRWVPYQLPTFVTPSFPAYASGHSSFSRAAAEVLTAFTGSEYFPGGVSGYTIKAGSLKFEKGPATDIRLEWATYYDAADQAGQSRLWGGIHIQADDFTGRMIGSACGKAAWARAEQYFDGSVRPS